jgi:ribose-phosphate pyrophosphokinase
LAQKKIHIPERMHEGVVFYFRQRAAAQATVFLGSAIAEKESRKLTEKTQRLIPRLNKVAQPTPTNIKGRLELEVCAGLDQGIRWCITIHFERSQAAEHGIPPLEHQKPFWWREQSNYDAGRIRMSLRSLKIATDRPMQNMRLRKHSSSAGNARQISVRDRTSQDETAHGPLIWTSQVQPEYRHPSRCGYRHSRCISLGGSRLLCRRETARKVSSSISSRWLIARRMLEMSYRAFPPKLISGNAHPVLAQQLAKELSVPLDPVEIAAFADGETRVHIAADLQDASVFIVQPTCTPVNDHLLVLAFLIDAARAAGAGHITAVVPYFGYARQEQRSRPGNARSAQVAARLLGSVGLDHLVTLDLHAPALESAFPMPVTHLRAEEVLLPPIKSWEIQDLAVVAPDAGGMKRAQRFALALNAPLAVIAKDRPRPDVAAPLQVLGDVRNRVCLIIDDMASTGRTLAGAADSLCKAGAREVMAAFTHAVMAPGALERLRQAQFTRILTTDSIPMPADSRLESVPIAPLLARAVRSLCGDEKSDVEVEVTAQGQQA